MSVRFSRVATIVLAALASIAVAAAAWKGRGLAWSEKRTATQPPAISAFRLADLPPPRLPATRPGEHELVGLLVGGAKGEVEFTDADPAGLAAPPGARRVSSARQATGDLVMEQARYLVNLSPDLLESFYDKRLTDAGWRRAVGKFARGGLAWQKAGQLCWLRMAQPTSGPENASVSYSVVVTTPAGTPRR